MAADETPSSVIARVLALAAERTGTVAAALRSPGGAVVAELAATDGRIWRLEVAGADVPPISRRVTAETREESARIMRSGAGADTLSRSSLIDIQRAHLDAIADGLVALGAVDSDGAKWEFRPASPPARTGRVRGHHAAAVAAALRRKGMEIVMTNLERAIAAQQTKVPECLAIGYVDMGSGMLIATKTVGTHPREVLDLVAAATADVFQGQSVSEIERQFRRSRGQQEDGAHYFQKVIMISGALIHVLIRGSRLPDHAAVFVCRSSANLGAVLSKAVLAAQAIEAEA